MGNRKNKGGKELLALPWHVSAVLAAGSFVGIRWVMPGFLPGSGPLAGLASTLEPISWIALAAFGVLALMAALRGAGKEKSRLTSRQQARTRFAPAAVHEPADAGAPAPAPDPRPPAWSVEALRLLEWKRFEILCARYYDAVGFGTATLAAGPDGGIDVKLFKLDPDKPLAIVQCKAWKSQVVGVKEIRELLGVMVHEKVRRGVFITTGSYTADAQAFGAANPIQLLDGEALVQKILQLPLEKQKALLDYAFDGDYRTPTCASCGVKMVKRDSSRGPFWGCAHYPRCRSTLAVRD